MKYSKLLLILLTGFVVSLGASEAKKAMEKRIAPVGSVCVQGQDCGTAVAETVADSSGARNGEAVYTNACATCHNIGLAGAPKFADASSWGARPDKGLEALTASVKNGLNGMPAMGMCMDVPMMNYLLLSSICLIVSSKLSLRLTQNLPIFQIQEFLYPRKAT